MNDFTASNGIGVRLDHRDLDIKNTLDWIGICGGVVVDALREFFRAEEDERLGRWRWPENPDYVVYGFKPGMLLLRVVDESDGTARNYYRDDMSFQSPDNEHRRTARAYLDAHSEPKPWDEAEVGEIWAFAIEGLDGEWAAVSKGDEEWEWADGGRLNVAPGHLKAARRIWPEVSE